MISNSHISKANQDQLKPEVYSQLRGCSPALCSFLAKKLHIVHSDHVLDIGCGPGENTALLAGLSGAQVEGLDLDEERVAYAQLSVPTIIFHQGDAENLPFKDTSFSVITMMLSIQRFRDRDKAFQHAGRVLQHEGRIGIVTIAREQLAVRPDFRVFPTALIMECKRFPDINTLCEELLRNGFTNIKTDTLSEVIRPLDRTFISWVENLPFTVFTKIPSEEFTKGINTIKNQIQVSSNVQLLKNEYTIITGMKP